MIDLDAIMTANVTLVLSSLDDTELAGLNLTLALGNDPRKLDCWSRIKPLFTQNNGTAMHGETKKAFARVVARRFGL